MHGIYFHREYERAQKTSGRKIRCYDRSTWRNWYLRGIFEIFTLKSLKRIDRPIVLYNIDGYYDKMKALLEYTAEEKFMDFSVLDLVVFLDEPTAVLDYLENYKK